LPSSKSTNNVSRSPKAEILQPGSGETRRIAFRAEDHDAQVKAVRNWQASGGGWVEAPFKDVSFDDDGTRYCAFLRSLAARADVNKHRRSTSSTNSTTPGLTKMSSISAGR
jgi:hypothetical protein